MGLLAALGSWLLGGGVSTLLNDALSAYKTAVASKDAQAAAQLQAQVQALQGAYAFATTAAGQRLMMLFGYTVWVYFTKCVIWDKVLGAWTHGTTDPLGGDIQIWGGLVIAFLFGHGIVSRLKG